MSMRRAVEWWEQYQIPLYLAAIAGGALVGFSATRVAPALAHSINPVLALLLFATFLGCRWSRSVGRSGTCGSWAQRWRRTS